MKSVKQRVVSGLAWTYAERISAQLVSTLITIILARLIAPEEYGVVSLVLVFIAFANVIVSDGLGSALIQKQDADSRDFSSMLFFSIGCGIVLYFILFFIAPFVEDYYETKELSAVLRILSLKIPLASINSIQQAYVSKKMDFKKFFFATLIGTVCSGVVGTFMAYNGWGVWALVTQYLTNSLMDTLFLGFVINWKPTLYFSWDRVKPMLSYAFELLSVSMLMTLYANIRNLIIGKKYSVEELSYTNKGQQFPSLISVNINSSISKVIFPAIAEVQDDLQKVKSITRQAVCVGSFLLSPLLVGLAAVAPVFVSMLLTDKWLPCVPYLRIMCIVYLLQPIQTASLQAMKALGKGQLYLRLQIIKVIGGMAILLWSVFFYDSAFSVVMSALFAEIFATFVNCRPNKVLMNYMYKEQIYDVLKPYLASFIMFVMVVLIGNLQINKFLLLFLQIGTGGLIYIGLNCLMKNEALFYTYETLKSFLRRENK